MKTHIFASAMAGHGCSESYTRFAKFLKVKPLLVYLHRNNKYKITKTNQKMIKDQVKFSKHRPFGPMLSISRNVRPSVRMSVCLCVCPCVCLFTFEVPFNCLFSPPSRSWMSNIFRDSESLGKSNGKNWSNIWTFWFGNGLKSPRKKNFFLLLILLVIPVLSRWYAGYNRLIPF